MAADEKVSAMFLNILYEHVRDLRRTEDYYRGYIDGVEAYGKFNDDLLKIGVKFVTCASNCKQSRCLKLLGTQNERTTRIVMQSTKGLPIIMFGSPFVVQKSLYMICKFGGQCRKKINKKQSSCLEQDEFGTVCKGVKSCQTRGTKKFGCRASMHVKKVTVFTDDKYNVPLAKTSVHVRNMAIKKSLKLLTADLMQGLDKISSVTRYYLEISPLDRHSGHGFGDENYSSQLIHPELTKKIGELVACGVTDTKTVRTVLCEYVRERYGCGDDGGRRAPTSNHRAFYPTSAAIRHQISVAKSSSLKQNRIDRLGTLEPQVEDLKRSEGFQTNGSTEHNHRTKLDSFQEKSTVELTIGPAAVLDGVQLFQLSEHIQVVPCDILNKRKEVYDAVTRLQELVGLCTDGDTLSFALKQLDTVVAIMKGTLFSENQFFIHQVDNDGEVLIPVNFEVVHAVEPVNAVELAPQLMTSPKLTHVQPSILKRPHSNNVETATVEAESVQCLTSSPTSPLQKIGPGANITAGFPVKVRKVSIENLLRSRGLKEAIDS